MNPYDALAHHWVAANGTAALDPLTGNRWNAHRAATPSLQTLPTWPDHGATAPLSEATLRALAEQTLSPDEAEALTPRLRKAVADQDLQPLLDFLAKRPAQPGDLELVGMTPLAAGEGAWRLSCHDVALTLHLELVGAHLQMWVEPSEGAWSELVVTAHGEDEGDSIELTPTSLTGAAEIGLHGVLGLEIGLYRLRHQRGAWRSLVAAALQPVEMSPVRVDKNAPASQLAGARGTGAP